LICGWQSNLPAGIWPLAGAGLSWPNGNLSFTFLNERDVIMGGKIDEAKGRIKEAAGALTGDDKLREEGKIDQAAGKVKQAVQTAVDKVRSAAENAVDKAKHATK
jgi:uncharacterized protein YjbJ (UPF0337 family)